MITMIDEAPEHFGAREMLLDQCFGEARFAKTSERLREGRLPVFAYAALDETGRLIGTVRLWRITDCNGSHSLLLGPLAVSPESRGLHVGDRLMCHALNQAAVHGHGSVILVGDLSYYARFGFAPGLLSKILLPGPVERDRLLGVEFVSGHLAGLQGLLSAARVPNPAPFFAMPENNLPVPKAA